MTLRTRHKFGKLKVQFTDRSWLYNQVDAHYSARCEVCREKYATLMLLSNEPTTEDPQLLAFVESQALEALSRSSYCYPNRHVRRVVNAWRKLVEYLKRSHEPLGGAPADEDAYADDDDGEYEDDGEIITPDSGGR